MEQNTWIFSDPGISFSASSGRITIYKTTLTALNHPPYFRFLFDTQQLQFAVEICGFASSGSHHLPEDTLREYHDIKSKDMVRFVYQTCGWDKRFTYRIKGITMPQRRMVVFDLRTAERVSQTGIVSPD